MNKKSGVTLMIMVITIVAILIISAGVTLNLGKTGIIKNTRKLDIQAQMKVYQFELEDYIKVQMQLDPNYDKSKLKVNGTETEKMKEIIPSFDSKYGSELAIVNGKLYQNKNVDIKAEKTKWIIETGINIYGGGNIYDNIPEGFEVVPDNRTEEEKKEVERGLIIIDKANGNQFVWIPVPDISKLHRDTFGHDPVFHNANASLQYPKEFDSNNIFITEQSLDFTVFAKSVAENGGFFIGRFETIEERKESYNVNNNDDPVPGIYQVSNFRQSGNEFIVGQPLIVNQISSIRDPNGIREAIINKAKKMYEKHPQVQSNVIYGSAFDYILNFLAEKEVVTEKINLFIQSGEKMEKVESIGPKVTKELLKNKDISAYEQYGHSSKEVTIMQDNNDVRYWNLNDKDIKCYSQYGICDLIGGYAEMTLEFLNEKGAYAYRGSAYLTESNGKFNSPPAARVYGNVWTGFHNSPRIIMYYR